MKPSAKRATCVHEALPKPFEQVPLARNRNALPCTSCGALSLQPPATRVIAPMSGSACRRLKQHALQRALSICDG